MQIGEVILIVSAVNLSMVAKKREKIKTETPRLSLRFVMSSASSVLDTWQTTRTGRFLSPYYVHSRKLVRKHDWFNLVCDLIQYKLIQCHLFPVSQSGIQILRLPYLNFHSGQRETVSFPRIPLNSHNSLSAVRAILVFTSEADFLTIIEPPASVC